MKRILLVILASGLLGCSPSESSLSADKLPNNLAQGGVLVSLTPDGQLENIPDIENSLSGEDKRRFNLSMQWIATETDFPLSELAGKSAHDVVEIANCLKTVGKTNEDCR